MESGRKAQPVSISASYYATQSCSGSSGGEAARLGPQQARRHASLLLREASEAYFLREEVDRLTNGHYN